MQPAAVLSLILRSPTSPRVTCYDDLAGPTSGERIELSAKVLNNWVSKAANLAQEEWEIGPSESLGIIASAHWRVIYWAWAAWSCGGAVDLRKEVPSAADALPWAAVVSTEASPALSDWPGALLTRASLARSASGPVPELWLDEAAELATYPDVFSAYATPEPSDIALIHAEGEVSYADLLDWAMDGRTLAPQARLAVATSDPLELVRATLGAFSVDGSVLLSAGASNGTPPQRRIAEGVTDDW